MSRSTLGLPDTVHQYLLDTSVHEPEILARLRAETEDLMGGRAAMQISPEQGQLMRLLVELIGARTIVEVGTFTGYSSLAMALALPDDGQIFCCDVSEEYTAVARRYWVDAGVDGKIDLRLAPAVETLNALRSEGRDGTVDMAFIDADKTGYQAYFEASYHLIRPGGLIMVDNVLWGGSVADTTDTQPDTLAIRAFNDALFKDDRVTLSLVPIGDGLTLARKR